MKDYANNVSFIPDLNVIQCTMATADYAKWQQEEGKLITALSDEVVHDDALTTITISAPWFEISKMYC